MRIPPHSHPALYACMRAWLIDGVSQRGPAESPLSLPLMVAIRIEAPSMAVCQNQSPFDFRGVFFKEVTNVSCQAGSPGFDIIMIPHKGGEARKKAYVWVRVEKVPRAIPSMVSLRHQFALRGQHPVCFHRHHRGKRLRRSHRDL